MPTATTPNIYTHDRIVLNTGLMAANHLLWGSNALQTVTVNRHTPKDVQQAIGHLGIVDFTTGQITSDVTLDSILVEASSKADTSGKTNSIYAFANQLVTPGVDGTGLEYYAMVSFALAFRAGAPATVNLGYLTPTIASALSVAAFNPSALETGEESSFAVVMGDDGSGILLATTWAAGFTAGTTNIAIMNADGTPGTVDGGGLPACVQSMAFNGRINRDHILDIRSAQPTQFVTTYPLDLTMDMEVCELPTDSAALLDPRFVFNKLQSIDVQATALNKHTSANTALFATNAASYGKAIGLTQIDASESISVGRYRTFTVNFRVADILCPLAAPA